MKQRVRKNACVRMRSSKSVRNKEKERERDGEERNGWGNEREKGEGSREGRREGGGILQKLGHSCCSQVTLLLPLPPPPPFPHFPSPLPSSPSYRPPALPPLTLLLSDSRYDGEWRGLEGRGEKGKIREMAEGK